MTSNWKEYLLEDITEKIFSGGTPSTKKNEYWNGEFPWLSSGETRNDFIYSTEKSITEEGIKNSSTKLAKKNDIVIASAGQGNTRGQVAFCKINTYINQSVIAVRTNETYLDPLFLFYNFKGRYRELRKISDGHSIRGSLTTKILKRLKIKVPAIKEQKKISSLLYSLDQRIETNNRINEKLEEMAQALFKHWFVDFEFPNDNGKPYKSSGGEMVDSELGMIPKGWEICQLDDLVDIIDNRGKTPPLSQNKTNYPIIDVKALTGTDRIVNYDNCSKFVDKTTYETWFRSGHPKTGDILLSTVGSIGELKLFFGDKGCIAQNVVALRTKNISYLYLFQYMRHIKKQLISYNIGSVQPSIKITHVKKHKILVPKKDIEDSFTEIIKNISFLIFNNSIENQRLVSIRDNLLPKLMSGEIRIPMEDGVLSEKN